MSAREHRYQRQSDHLIFAADHRPQRTLQLSRPGRSHCLCGHGVCILLCAVERTCRVSAKEYRVMKPLLGIKIAAKPGLTQRPDTPEFRLLKELRPAVVQPFDPLAMGGWVENKPPNLFPRMAAR